MAYDEGVATRLRTAVMRAGPEGLVEERKMFGGLVLLLDGSMACGVLGSELMIRVAETDAAAALRRPHARPMEFTGRPLRAFLVVASPGFAAEAELDAWVTLALAAARAKPRRERSLARAGAGRARPRPR
jgi:TfoX/Sxy family transcriptional regulator of competence genes